MEIERRGAERDHGPATLCEFLPSFLNPDYSKRAGRLLWRSKGFQRGSTYNYYAHIPNKDVIAMVKAIGSEAKTKADKALAHVALTAIEQLLAD
jgi:hypothetical protein